MKSNIFSRIVRKAGRILGNQTQQQKPSPDDPYCKDVLSHVPAFQKKLNAIKSKAVFSKPDLFWHPYDVLSNFSTINDLLTGKNRNMLDLFDNLPVADIGAADGDLSFFLESRGVKNIHILEYAPTSCNRLEGLNILKKELNSSVQIHEIDIDSRGDLPCSNWGVVFLLGTLYHLKNPYYVLEKLAACSKYCFLSTRITRFAPDNKTDLSGIPCAYLFDESECNNDKTNFWVFSNSGLKRIVTRAGWDICDYMTCGSDKSTPASMENTQRAFCLLKSRTN